MTVESTLDGTQPSPEVHKVLSALFKTEEGTAKIASAMVHPTLNRLRLLPVLQLYKAADEPCGQAVLIKSDPCTPKKVILEEGRTDMAMRAMELARHQISTDITEMVIQHLDRVAVPSGKYRPSAKGRYLLTKPTAVLSPSLRESCGVSPWAPSCNQEMVLLGRVAGVDGREVLVSRTMLDNVVYEAPILGEYHLGLTVGAKYGDLVEFPFEVSLSFKHYPEAVVRKWTLPT